MYLGIFSKFSLQAFKWSFVILSTEHKNISLTSLNFSFNLVIYHSKQSILSKVSQQT